MKNRDLLKSRLLSPNVDPYLKVELNHYMQVDHEDPEDGEQPYDIVDAFEDTMQFAERNLDNKLLKICRKIFIEVGFYVPMSQKEIQNTYVTSGTVWDFKMGGIPYKWVSDWMDK